MPEPKCHYCGCIDDSDKHELRPYGPKGAWVCFPCAMKTPKRKAAAARQFRGAMAKAEQDAGPGGIVEIGGRRGLRARRAVKE